MKRAFFLALGMFILAACGTSNEGSCERIAEACHDKDTGSGEPHDCHETSESSTDDQCAEIEADCLAACE
ncbi:MAG: hypothetical protein IPK82_16295 [Polyangiaceae bacterium]|nr:hypothetical protein [Polyangiaceae bacterium]